MQLKVSTDYAIRIVLHLAIKGGAATSSEISGQMGIPQSVIATLAKPLQKAGHPHHPAGHGRRLCAGAQAGGHLPLCHHQRHGGHHPHQPLPGAGRFLLPRRRPELSRPQVLRPHPELSG